MEDKFFIMNSTHIEIEQTVTWIKMDSKVKTFWISSKWMEWKKILSRERQFYFQIY